MNPREKKIVEAQIGKEAEIGRWLWALEDARQRTLEEVNGLSPAILDWQPPDGENSIGTMLYHMADIEHDAEHRSQIESICARAERSLAKS